MTVRELREKYLAFFESKGHMRHPSGSLIPFDVTGKLDESLLFNGAGMVQFKPYFRGVATPPNPRLTTAQKCVRTGDIESVGDTSHLTFFEMLGNFSFGNYFRTDAIKYSWEFLTSKEWLGLDPNFLSFTVFNNDDEAYETWSELFRSVGINPDYRVFRLGEETNYWPAGAYSAGPPGPCGPNSEMFYWTANTPPPGEGYTVEDWLRDDDAKNWLEIWNDVFIQYEWQGHLRNPERPSDGYVKDGMPELPFKSIDTGMGLERTAYVLGGFKSVYDTDAFQPILRVIEGISAGSYRYGSDETRDTAARIIADHIRTACFCIADGILPGNNGRGYVLRRLIRRAVLKGQRGLAFEEPFFHRVYEGVVEAMGDHYTDLVEKRELIVTTLINEEELFRKTVRQGTEILRDELSKLAVAGKKILDGASAFKLYDTYGFPLEVTRELCTEAGVDVDEDGYEVALKEAQERSRGSQNLDSVYGGVTGINFVIMIDDEEEPQPPTPTKFVGYDQTQTQTQIAGMLAEGDAQGRATGLVVLALEESPFYAESGGQVGDTGVVAGAGFTGKVVDTIKQQGVWIHAVEVETSPIAIEGYPAEEVTRTLNERLMKKTVEASVDTARRGAITRNHTATHLLHAALRDVLGRHVNQAGSYVGPDRLRFDFSHGKAMSHEEIATVERIVNEQILENTPVQIYSDIPITEAKARGAMALFGEKYGDFVRMVEIGDFSRELCGGIHVRATGGIGPFKILSENSAASGVRRIEAVTGTGTFDWMDDQSRQLREAMAKLKLGPRAPLADLSHQIDRLLEAQRELKAKLDRARSQGGDAEAAVEAVGSVQFAVANLGESDAAEAKLAVDRLVENQPLRVGLAVAIHEGKVIFAGKVGADALAKGAHAGNMLKAAAMAAGGGGGGRPDFATAGGKDPAKVNEAISAAKAALASMVN
ncbi:MAG: alanine--tRNA ligase [Armatimonadetes bacterium]|nr:alanine--tRNA ligase [Armatimonadota bacterium]